MEQPHKPTLVMLFLDASGISNIEEALRRELELNIETHRLVTERGFRFTKATLPDKIEEIRHLAAAANGEAVIWIERKDSRTVTLQLVVLAPGQFTVQSVEAGVDQNEIGELTIAARELLRDIRISMGVRPSKPTEDATLRRVSQSSPGPESVPARRAFTHFLSLNTGIERSFKKQTESPLLLGGTVGFGRVHASHVCHSLELSIFGASSSSVSDARIQTFGVRPGGRIGYLWKTRFVTVGTFMGLLIPFQTVQVTLDNGMTKKDSWWNIALSPEVSLRFPIGERTAILMGTAIELLARQKVLKRTSDQSTLFTTPYLAGSITVGLIIAFH